MPGGIHLLLGLLLLFFVPETHTKKRHNPTIEWMKAGIVFGSLLPDIDLPIVIVTVCFTYIFLGYRGENVELAENLHRSATHTFFLWIPLLLLFGMLYARRVKRVESDQQKPQQHEHPHHPHSTVDWIGFIFGTCIGAIVHVLSDTIYLKGVRMFWPVYNAEIFFEIPALYMFGVDKYSLPVQKFLVSYDHFSEVPSYLILFWARRVFISGHLMKSDKRKSTFSNDSDRHLVWRALIKGQFLQLSESEWVYVYRWSSVLQTVLIWLFYLIGAVIFSQMEFVHFFVFMYFPGTVFFDIWIDQSLVVPEDHTALVLALFAFFTLVNFL